MNDDPGSPSWPLLRVDRVSRQYPDGNVRALEGISFEVARGQYVAIVGPSGSGKSTLLNLLGVLDRPNQGQIWFDGEPLEQIRNLDRLRSEKVGFVFQSFFLIPTLTALENVQIPMIGGPLGSTDRVQRAKDLLAAVGVAHRASHLPARMSTGERQRTAIARALANRPALLLADEPTGNLDSQTGAEILDLFDRLHREQGLTLVVITHSAEVAERAQRVIEIRDGHLVSDRNLSKCGS